MISTAEAVALTREMLEAEDIPVVDVAATAFPEEVVILAKVPEDAFQRELFMSVPRSMLRSRHKALRGS
jgi:hypothetical protein